ncbi:MAG: AAA family ATPase [Planctomycetes bacterium]|nr:AAA family ATPase [Planctomycetota bacterium]
MTVISVKRKLSLANRDFLPLAEHALAFSALDRLCRPADRSLPRLVYLYGPAGIGKTLLVRSFQREILTADNQTRVRHFSASDWLDVASRVTDPDHFAVYDDALHGCSFLLCEDLHLLVRNRIAQRLLTAMIDGFLADDGKIVLTASGLPAEFSGLMPRLISRCHAGISAGMGLPGVESRRLLIRHFAQKRQLAVTDVAVQMLAESMPVTPRELSAAVTQLDAQIRFTQNRCVSAACVQRFLTSGPHVPRLTLSKIARVVARHFGLTLKALQAGSRSRQTVLARHTAMFLARENSGKSTATIARFFRRRNHSTVVHACRRIPALAADDAILRSDLRILRSTLGIVSPDAVDNSFTNCA